MNKRILLATIVLSLLTGCSKPTTRTSDQEPEQKHPVYDCRTINYYDYAKPVPSSEEPVEDDYFNDVFLGGDSRMGSLYLFSDLRDKGADVQYCESLSLYRIYDMAMTDSGKPLYDIVLDTKRKNIYLLLGINEIRNSDFEDWGELYQELIDEIKQANPGCHIYLMGSYHPREVSGLSAEELSAHLEMLNGKLQSLAEKNLCYYLDTNDGMLDDSGLLKSELTWDGLHFNIDGSQAFSNQIARHVVKENLYVKEMCE